MRQEQPRAAERDRRLHPELPLFALEDGSDVLLYAPGHLCRIAGKDLPAFIQALGQPGDGGRLARPARELRTAAEEAQRTWVARLTAAFAPECLLLYVSNHCNLACRYCYSAQAPRGPDAPVLSEAAVRAAARRVARACAEKALPFTLVLHGGGEPTLHAGLIRRIVGLTRAVAAEAGLVWTAHVATNGVLPEAQARWLAREIGSIGLSCDGPPDIQDRLRPGLRGGASSAAVERTARAVCAEGGRIEVRATIVPETVDRQAEIVAYAAQALGAKAVRFEPAYAVRTPARALFAPQDAERFVRGFLEAAEVARRMGVDLTCSGVRLDELHGPHCSALRDVLHVLPDGSASACFFCVDGREAQSERARVGHFDEDAGEYVLDQGRIAAWRGRAGAIPPACLDCIAQLHCARECPEACLGGEDSGPRRGFRCRTTRLLAEALVRQCAAALPRPAPRATGRAAPVPGAPGEATRLDALLRELPRSVDAEAIRAAWRAACAYHPLEARGLPEPLWARRAYEHGGVEAWRVLEGLRPSIHERHPISVYVHVPFCDIRCAFCDCYSVASSRRHDSPRERRFIATWLDRIAAWTSLPVVRDRPVTTVHFGGGTPSHLPEADFDRMLAALRARLATHEKTEWAIEATSRLCGDEALARLWDRGFRRLHVGVQTLEDPVRRLIGRHESAAQVLERLRSALARGVVVSADLIYGLPGQTTAGWLDTLARLVGVGVHGVSLYQLQVSQRNRRFLARGGHAQHDALFELVLFQCAEQILIRAGFAKNHFTHFARAGDLNLYSRHVTRGEDLLSLGPSADGIFGDYHYRHAELDAYLSGKEGAGLEGGLRETEREARLRPISAALMSGAFELAALETAHAGRLLERWSSFGLVRETAPPGTFALTANGSWFVREMLNDLEAAATGNRE